MGREGKVTAEGEGARGRRRFGAMSDGGTAVTDSMFCLAPPRQPVFDLRHKSTCHPSSHVGSKKNSTAYDKSTGSFTRVGKPMGKSKKSRLVYSSQKAGKRKPARKPAKGQIKARALKRRRRKQRVKMRCRARLNSQAKDDNEYEINSSEEDDYDDSNGSDTYSDSGEEESDLDMFSIASDSDSDAWRPQTRLQAAAKRQAAGQAGPSKRRASPKELEALAKKLYAPEKAK